MLFCEEYSRHFTKFLRGSFRELAAATKESIFVIKYSDT